MADGAPVGLQYLPPELMLMVLQAVEDLPSLASLVLASKQAWDAFHMSSPQLINPLVGQMPVHLRRYPRWIAIVSSLKSPDSPYATEGSNNIQDFINRYTNLHGLRGLDDIRDGGYHFPPLREDLARKEGPLDVLFAVRLVEMLAPVCLSRPIALLSELEEGHPPTSVTTYQNAAGVQRNVEMPEGDSFYAVGYSEPPSYVERTRVEEALWRLLTNSYTRLLPQMPKYGPSRENINEWHRIFEPHELEIADLVAGGWNRDYYRGTYTHRVNFTMQRTLMYCR